MHLASALDKSVSNVLYLSSPLLLLIVHVWLVVDGLFIISGDFWNHDWFSWWFRINQLVNKHVLFFVGDETWWFLASGLTCLCFSILGNPQWIRTMIWLVVYLPIWKIWKSVGIIIPNLWKIYNQPYIYIYHIIYHISYIIYPYIIYISYIIYHISYIHTLPKTNILQKIYWVQVR